MMHTRRRDKIPTTATTATRNRTTTMSPPTRRARVATNTWTTTHSLWLYSILLVGSLMVDTAFGALSCNTTEYCEQTLRIGSVCLNETNTCSNPFQRGCLSTLLPEDHELRNNIRVCNSDDVLPDAVELGLCYQPDFNYEELRIHNVSLLVLFICSACVSLCRPLKSLYLQKWLIGRLHIC